MRKKATRQRRSLIFWTRRLSRWPETWLARLAVEYKVPLIVLEQMSYGQAAREIAIYLAEYIREQARIHLAPPSSDSEERSRRRKALRRLKASTNWIDRLIYKLYLREKRSQAQDDPQ